MNPHEDLAEIESMTRTAELCVEELRKLGFVDPVRATQEHRGPLDYLLVRAREAVRNKRW